MTRLSWTEENAAVKAAVESFPSTFGLRAFPGKTFKACPRASYYGHNGVVIYTAVRTDDGTWAAWVKGTPAEVRREMIETPKGSDDGS